MEPTAVGPARGLGPGRYQIDAAQEEGTTSATPDLQEPDGVACVPDPDTLAGLIARRWRDSMGDDMPPDARRALHTVRLTGEVLAAVVRDLLTRRPVVILQDPFYTWETQVLRLPDSAGARLAEAMNAFGLDPTLVTRVDEAVRAFTAWSRTAAAEAFAREAIRQARSDAADEADQERRRSP